MEIVVVGAGSLGSLIGGLLTRTHDVTLVGRDPHMSAVRDDGLEITGEIETRVFPTARTATTDLSGDLLIVTVKAYQTANTAQELTDSSFRWGLSLQNGLGNESILAAHLDCSILAGTTTYGAEVSRPGVVTCNGIGQVDIAPWEKRGNDDIDLVTAAFEESGITIESHADGNRLLWEKTVVSCAINPITALAGVKNGALRDPPLKRLSLESLKEAVAVATADGVSIELDRAKTRLAQILDGTAENHSSMYQDIRAGNRSEIEAISGEIARRGDAHGIETPVNDTLWALLSGWENRKTRSWR